MRARVDIGGHIAIIALFLVTFTHFTHSYVPHVERRAQHAGATLCKSSILCKIYLISLFFRPESRLSSVAWSLTAYEVNQLSRLMYYIR